MEFEYDVVAHYRETAGSDSKFTILYHFHEVQVDVDGDHIRRFCDHLPHSGQIVTSAVQSWNEHMKPGYLDFRYKDEIKSIYAYPSHTDADSMCITIELKKGNYWDEWKRREAYEAIGEQICDRWGDDFFGPTNTVFDEETHTRYYAE